MFFSIALSGLIFFGEGYSILLFPGLTPWTIFFHPVGVIIPSHMSDIIKNNKKKDITESSPKKVKLKPVISTIAYTVDYGEKIIIISSLRNR